MKTVSSILLVLSLWLAVLLGGQTEAWSWGPAMLALGAAVACGLATKPWAHGSKLLWIPLVLAVAWIVWRASFSPVAEFARADFMLVLALLGTAWVVSGLDFKERGIQLLYLGVAISVIANVVMAMVQWRVPEAMWPYSYRPSLKPTGFFGHYNYFANYVIGASLLVLGRVFFSNDRMWLRGVYGLAYLGTLIIVPLSGSRGGLLALGAGSFVFLVAVAVIGWREKRKWLPAAVIALPVVLVGGAAAGWMVLGKIQHDRGQTEKFTQIADGSVARLEWVNLALEVSSDHLASGGGSRAFSWERNLKWQADDFGYGEVDEPFVHNELLQTVTDYGVIGAVLVLAALLVVVGVTMTSLFTGKVEAESETSEDAVWSGVAAGGAAILLQANFSFVFHMMPSSMLLGLIFGLALMAWKGERKASAVGGWMRHCLAILLLPFILFLGWNATAALRLVWPVIYAKPPMVAMQPRVAMEHLERAASHWPGSRLLMEKASWARFISSSPEVNEDEKREWNEVAVDAYRRARVLHPYSPEIAVNLGNAASDAGLHDEAEESLEKAVELQGGLEAGFRARYYLALHLYGVWRERWVKERRSQEALGQFIRARELLKTADPLIPWTLRHESAELKKGISDSIKFLEGAGVRPAEIDQ